jgi:hypothetical protein
MWMTYFDMRDSGPNEYTGAAQQIYQFMQRSVPETNNAPQWIITTTCPPGPKQQIVPRKEVAFVYQEN